MKPVAETPFELKEILEVTLMGCALDFAIAWEKRDEKLMRTIHHTIFTMSQNAPGFLAEVKRRQNATFGQIKQDISNTVAGKPMVTPTPSRFP